MDIINTCQEMWKKNIKKSQNDHLIEARKYELSELTGLEFDWFESSLLWKFDSAHTSIPHRKKDAQSDKVAFLDLIRMSAKVVISDFGRMSEKHLSIAISCLSIKCKMTLPDSILMSSTGFHEPNAKASNAVQSKEFEQVNMF